MISNPVHQLTVRDLDLVEDEAEALAVSGYAFSVAGGESFDLGNPAPITEEILSWLADGALVATTGQENATGSLLVGVKGATLDDVARGTARLVEAVRGSFDLKWTPPDGDGEPCVFEVVEAHLERVWGDDMAELRTKRWYRLVLTRLPWVRSASVSVVGIPAPTVGSPANTVVDDGSSLTNWTGDPGPSVNNGVAVGRTGAHGSTVALWLQRGALSIATGYVRVKFRAAMSALPPWGPPPISHAIIDSVSWSVNGVTVPIVASANSGRTIWLDARGLGTVSTLRASVTASLTIGDPTWAAPPGASLGITEIASATTPGDIAQTGRQSSRSFPVGGSVRTPATLSVAAGSASGLADVNVYTTSSMTASPTMRDKITTGPSSTADAATVSGARSALATKHVFRFDAGDLPPGLYVIVARVRAALTVTRTITWATKTKLGSTETPGDTGATTVDLTANTWHMTQVATVQLPPRDVGSEGSVLIELQADAATDLDEAWVYDLTRGQLTMVSCGTGAAAAGGPSSRLWIDAPALANDGKLTMWAGTTADRSDAREVSDQAQARGMHEFTPGTMHIHLVTTGVTNATTSLTHNRRFFDAVTRDD